MDIYTKTARDLLREAGVTLVTEGARTYLDAASLRNLEMFVGELRAKYEGLLDVVLAVGAAPTTFRYSKKELKAHQRALTRRLKHLHALTATKRAQGVHRDQTSYDRQEVAALGVAIPLVEAALIKAVEDEGEHPGGTLLSAFPGPLPGEIT